MKILITGATGLVGQEVVKRCHQKDYVVHYLTTSKSKIETTDNYKGFYWNPLDGELDEAALEGVAIIIHLAGASIAQRWTDKNKKLIRDSRVESAKLLYTTLSRKQSQGQSIPKHFISASAVGGYPSSMTKYYDEQYPNYADGFLGSVVKEWEEAVIDFQRLDVMTSLVRTGIVLDEKEGALPKITKPIRYGAGAPLGSGQQWQSWIHIDDLADIYMFIMEQSLHGIYNAVAPNPVTNQKLTQIIANHLGKKILLPNIPKFVLKLTLGDMAAIVLESQKVSSEKIRGAGYVFHYTAAQSAVHDLL